MHNAQIYGKQVHSMIHCFSNQLGGVDYISKIKTCEKKVGVETGNKAKVSYTTIDTKREVKPCSGRQ